MRLVVCGGKHLDDARLVERELRRMHARRPISVLIHGGHPVLGGLLESWARAMRINVVRYPANWQQLGSRAEDMRNAFMLEDARPDAALVLPGGRDSRRFARQALLAGVPVTTVGAPGADADPSDDEDPDRVPWDRHGPALVATR